MGIDVDLRRLVMLKYVLILQVLQGPPHLVQLAVQTQISRHPPPYYPVLVLSIAVAEILKTGTNRNQHLGQTGLSQ